MRRPHTILSNNNFTFVTNNLLSSTFQLTHVTQTKSHGCGESHGFTTWNNPFVLMTNSSQIHTKLVDEYNKNSLLSNQTSNLTTGFADNNRLGSIVSIFTMFRFHFNFA